MKKVIDHLITLILGLALGLDCNVNTIAHFLKNVRGHNIRFSAE